METTRRTSARQFALFLVFAATAVVAQPDTIRIFRVGSSSFPAELLTNTGYIMAASGDYVLEQQSSLYTRLDDIVKDPPSYDSWLDRHIPWIESGNFDYVIIQTINWVYINPAEHDTLFQRMLPDLVSRIRAVGPEVILYDKWNTYGCYPDHVRNNNLFHIEAGVRADIDKITFVGGAVWELWADDYFDDDMGFLFVGGNNGGGHPGAMANYMTACILSYILTGVTPVGNPVRNVKLQPWAYDTWQSLSGSDPLKGRVVDGHLVLTEWEADTLQRTALRWYRQWDSTLEANAASPAAFSATMADIEAIEAEYGNYRSWTTIGWLIDQLDDRCSPYDPLLTTEELQQLREATRLFSDRVEQYARSYLTAEQYDQFVSDYHDYWLQRNSKLRDDIYYQSLVAQASAEKLGNTSEFARMTTVNEVFLEILSLAAENLLMERITPAQREELLSTFTWSGAPDSYAPQFGLAQLSAVTDQLALADLREVYFGVWDNVDLMDELKSSGFSLAVWLDADTRFAQAVSSVPSVPPPLTPTHSSRERLPMRKTAGGFVFSPTRKGGTFTVTLMTPSGRAVASVSGAEPTAYRIPDVLRSGVFLLRYRSGEVHITRSYPAVPLGRACQAD
ncbi:MAG: hypothetical protein GF331_09230 [Chitinivibrionales bacterium]|nr:hypothetical protein [Chitinivibrionales bacterium]